MPVRKQTSSVARCGRASFDGASPETLGGALKQQLLAYGGVPWACRRQCQEAGGQGSEGAPGVQAPMSKSWWVGL